VTAHFGPFDFDGNRPVLRWSRPAYLYQGIEAVVFAACGAFFGTVAQGTVVSTALSAKRKRVKTPRAMPMNHSWSYWTGFPRDNALDHRGAEGTPPPASDGIGASTPPTGVANADLNDHVLEPGEAVERLGGRPVAKVRPRLSARSPRTPC